MTMTRDRKNKATIGKIRVLGQSRNEQFRARFLAAALSSLVLFGLGYLYAKNLLLISP